MLYKAEWDRPVLKHRTKKKIKEPAIKASVENATSFIVDVKN